MRLDLDIRRHWRCPACGTERHTPGKVTYVPCHFCKDHPAMHLVEPARPHREPPAPLDPIIDLHPDDIDAPAFVPAHLREPEPAASTETMTEILTEPPAEEAQPSDPAAVATAAAAAVVDEPEVTPAATSADEATPEETPKSKRKKRRGRRQRRRNRSNPSGEGDSAQQMGSGSAADDHQSSGGDLDS